eukprot:2382479-Pyramimonas_sp.AAC.1
MTLLNMNSSLAFLSAAALAASSLATVSFGQKFSLALAMAAMRAIFMKDILRRRVPSSSFGAADD